MTRPTRADQLTLLRAAPPAGRRLPGRIRPMESEPGEGPFDDPGFLFEPWWPGTRALVFLESGALRMQAEQLADPLAALPELRHLGRQLVEDDTVLDGMLLVLDRDGRPDPALLRAHLDGVARAGGRPAYLAIDLLYRRGRAVTRRPFAERRALLDDLVRPTDWCGVSRGYRAEGTTVAEALTALGLAAMSARRLDAPYHAGPGGDAWLRIPLAPVTRPARPTLTVIRSFGL